MIQVYISFDWLLTECMEAAVFICVWMAVYFCLPPMCVLTHLRMWAPGHCAHPRKSLGAGPCVAALRVIWSECNSLQLQGYLITNLSVRTSFFFVVVVSLYNQSAGTNEQQRHTDTNLTTEEIGFDSVISISVQWKKMSDPCDFI